MVIRSVHNTSEMFVFFFTRQRWGGTGRICHCPTNEALYFQQKVRSLFGGQNFQTQSSNSQWEPTWRLEPSQCLTLVAIGKAQLLSIIIAVRQSGWHLIVTWFPPHNGRILCRNMWDSKIILRPLLWCDSVCSTPCILYVVQDADLLL